MVEVFNLDSHQWTTAHSHLWIKVHSQCHQWITDHSQCHQWRRMDLNLTLTLFSMPISMAKNSILILKIQTLERSMVSWTKWWTMVLKWLHQSSMHLLMMMNFLVLNKIKCGMVEERPTECLETNSGIKQKMRTTSHTMESMVNTTESTTVARIIMERIITVTTTSVQWCLWSTSLLESTSCSLRSIWSHFPICKC